MTVSDPADIQSRLRPYVPELLLGWPDDVPWQALDGSMVSADISGFTALSERLADRGREGDEELSLVISDCFAGMIEDCATRGGDIIKFGGDALLVWFHDDGHARRAVSSALAMQLTIRRPRCTSDGRRVPLSISIGVNSGIHHIVRVIGEVPDLIVTGPGASATVRAESDAKAGMVLATAATAELLPKHWLGDVLGSGVVVRRRQPDPPPPPGLLTPGLTTPGPLTPAPRHWPSQLVPPSQQATILAGITNEHRQVAMSFLVFGGADDLAAHGQVDVLAQRLQILAESVTRENDRNGTFLLSTDVAPDGGKFILAAGAPTALGNHEDRLLRTVRAVIDADPGLQLHGGVHRGSLYSGDLGSPRRRVYTLLGDSMNLAARLSGRAAPGQIVVSRVAMEWSSVEFEFNPLPPFHVKGKAQPVHAGLLGSYVGRSAKNLGVDGPFLGRRAELDLVLGLVDAAAAGTSTAVAVVGPPGMGTTRVLAEVVASCDRARVVVARCTALDRLRGDSAVADIVRSLLGEPDGGDGDVIDRLAVLGLERFPRSVGLLPLVAPLFGVDLVDTDESALVPSALRSVRAGQLLLQIITALVDQHTVLLVDDLDLADDITREVIALLCESELDIPLCTVVSTSNDAAPSWMVVELDPMSPAETQQLVDHLLADADVPADVARNIVERSSGNPMFATALVAAVVDGGTELPDSLDEAIEVRLDRLDPGDRTILRAAAVLGSVVDLALLGQLLDPDALRDQRRWDRLSEFLERVGPGEVRFRNDTQFRAAYGGLPFRQRRALHRRVLELLELLDDGGSTSHDRLAVLAHHAWFAGDHVATWKYASDAGAGFAAASRYTDAARLYRFAWAARLAVPSDEVRRVCESMADVFEMVGDLSAADETLGKALVVKSDSAERARLLRKRGDVAERLGDYARALRCYRDAARELRRVGWAVALAEQARLDCARSGLAFRQSQFDEAWRYGNLALSQAERAGEWMTAARAALMVDNLITQISWSGVTVSRPDVLGLHHAAGDLVGAARWLSNQAVDRYYEGHWDEAVAMYGESAEQCVRFGHLVSEATALNNIAEIHSDRGQLDAARLLFRNARRSWRAIGYAVGVAVVQANLGRLATRRGDYDEAVPLLTDAIDRFERLGMPSMTADARLRLVEHAVLSGGVVMDSWWPDDADLADDRVVGLYRDRVRAVTLWLAGDALGATELAAATAQRAHDAAVPFEESLALRVLAAVSGSHAHDDQIDALHRRLGIVMPPPVVPG